MSEWKEYKLDEVARFQEGYVNPSQTVRDYFDGDIKWLRANDLNDSFVYNTTRTLTEKGFRSAGKSALLFKPDSIAISKSGTIGRLGILKDFMCGNRAVINIEPNHEKCNSLFLFYCLKNNYSRIIELAQGSVQKNLYIPILKELKIKVPELKLQKNIAEVLSSIDDKIELNNKINQELETLAQTLFKQWFIDFEFPNDNGEPYKSSGGVMVDSDLGEIPKGWSIITLNDVLSLKNGYAFKGMDFIDNGIPVIKIKNVKSAKINFNNLSYVSENVALKAEKFKINKFDLLITMSGNRIDGSIDTWVGKVGMFPKNGEYLLNQRVSILNLNNIRLRYYLLQLLSSEEFQYYFISNATSSGGQANISPDLIYKTQILLPETNKIEIFDGVANDIYSIIFNNMSENESLIKLRDTLLPKLISGELEINEISN